MLKTRAVILAKVETSYGVDAVPSASSNAILCELPELEVVQKFLERKNARTYYGAVAGVSIGEAVKIKFATELKGSGTAGTAPEIDPLFRACNYTKSNTPATKDDYDPNSNQSAGESTTIYMYQHDIVHKIVGCRGTFTVDLTAGEYGKINWEFTGIYAAAEDGSIPSITVNATVPPRFLSAAFAIDSYAAVVEKIKIDAGNEIGRRPSANAATGILEYFIKDRKVTGEIDPEVVALAIKSFWGMWSGNTLVAFTATVGSVAGNRCVITAPKVQVSDVKYAERENLLTHALKLNFTPNSGNDEIKFSFT